jgi:hypothetical protein
MAISEYIEILHQNMLDDAGVTDHNCRPEKWLFE